MSSSTAAPAAALSPRARFSEAWLARPVPNLLSGLVVALALIPEAIAFSIIAGVDPKVGLYASFSISMRSCPARCRGWPCRRCPSTWPRCRSSCPTPSR